MLDKSKVIEKWTGEKAIRFLHSTGAIPTGYIAEILSNETVEHQVLEVGCGAGRIAPLFVADEYLGIDINVVAIKQAQEAHSEYDFRQQNWDDDFPKGRSNILFWTVLLHVPDECLSGVIEKCTKSGAKRIFVVESMSSRYRKMGMDFQRDSEDYKLAFQRHGWGCILQVSEVNNGFPEHMDLLVFHKDRKEVE